MSKNYYPDRSKNPKGGSMQKLRIKRQSNCIRSDTVHLGHPAIKRPLIWSVYKLKTRDWGNSKLLGRITIILFNVLPHIFSIFQMFQRYVEPCPWQATTQFIKFEPVPIYLELSFILFANFLLFLMAILKAKFFKIQNFFYIFWKVWTTNTLSLNSWVGEAWIIFWKFSFIFDGNT